MEMAEQQQRSMKRCKSHNVHHFIFQIPRVTTEYSLQISIVGKEEKGVFFNQDLVTQRATFQSECNQSCDPSDLAN